MTYELPAEEFPVADVARNLVMGANQFRDSLVEKYQASYDEFWGLERRTVEQQQATLDRLGMSGLQILQDAAGFVAYLETAYAGSLPVKYHTTPYEYTVEDGPRIVLGELKAAWIPEPEEEEIDA